jgi:hypothetical protein
MRLCMKKGMANTFAYGRFITRIQNRQQQKRQYPAASFLIPIY